LLPQELAKRYSVVERLLSDDKIRQAALEMVKRGSITGCWRAFDWFCQISRLAVCRQLWRGSNLVHAAARMPRAMAVRRMLL